MKLALNLLAPRFQRSQTKEVQQLQTYLGELWQKLQTLVEDINNASAQDTAYVPDITAGEIAQKLMDGGIVQQWAVGMLDAAYPVGSYYYSANATNPHDLFGVGTWEQVAQGRVLVGVGGGVDANGTTKSFAAGDTGGTYSETLTVEQIPSHSHSITARSANGSTSPQIESFASGDSARTCYTNDTGGGQAHNNVMPYLACYIFKRTA